MNHRVFGTSGASLCEQKKDGERTEELPAESRTRDDVEEHSEVDKSDDPAVKSETRPEAPSQNMAEIPASDLKSEAEQKAEEKKGKQGLLELLRVMKVDTTTKTKLKSLRKVTSGQDSAVKPNRVVMESTSSMFKQATTPQR